MEKRRNLHVCTFLGGISSRLCFAVTLHYITTNSNNNATMMSDLILFGMAALAYVVFKWPKQSSEQKLNDPTHALSEDSLGLVFQFLSLHEVAICCRVCSAWHDFLLGDDIMWKYMMENLWWFTTQPRIGGARDMFRNAVCSGAQLVKYLERGRFVDNCDTRSWLLCGHRRKVMSILEIDDFIVTVCEDGEIRGWKIPFASNRPAGRLLLQKDDRVGILYSVVTVGSKCIAVSGEKSAAIIYFWKDQDENSMSCRVTQYLCGHGGPVRCLCFDGSEKVLIT